VKIIFNNKVNGDNMYLLRLDDACEYRDIKNWKIIEELLYYYNIKPIISIIPKCQDKQFIEKYKFDKEYYKQICTWKKYKWTFAMHGLNHVFHRCEGGLNPINEYSEFVNIPLCKQKEMIKEGIEILHSININPKIFVAPAHTFDNNTILALKDVSNIRVINDTIASDIYYKDEIFYIPQQSGKVRILPLRCTCFCYHPNEMIEKDFVRLRNFLKIFQKNFICYDDITFKKRDFTKFDMILKKIYFCRKMYE
jgi:hypothetical protein